jgi:branched-subunit amino acid aminotransferase/4-amino-4-deoxychorismate lyase
VAQHNFRRLDPHDDLAVCLFLTPGIHPDYGTSKHEGPTIGVHSYPLPFHAWQRKYTEGLSLVTVSTRQVPGDCWPSELKCRSRMHYYLAAREADERCPGATALLLDHLGYVTETPTANLIAFFAKSGLVSPPREKIVAGVSLGYVVELAAKRGIATEFRDITPDELATADELLLASTSYCVLPVARFDDRSLTAPGPLFRDLLADWSARVHVDIAQQASRFATRR